MNTQQIINGNSQFYADLIDENKARLTDEDRHQYPKQMRVSNHPCINQTNKDMSIKTDLKQFMDMSHHALNRIKELEHRLAMVKEDSAELQRFITDNGMGERFERPTDMCDEAWSHFANIDIACDLNSNEASDWKPFNK
jgi:hypothetical protein